MAHLRSSPYSRKNARSFGPLGFVGSLFDPSVLLTTCVQEVAILGQSFRLIICSEKHGTLREPHVGPTKSWKLLSRVFPKGCHVELDGIYQEFDGESSKASYYMLVSYTGGPGDTESKPSLSMMAYWRAQFRIPRDIPFG